MMYLLGILVALQLVVGQALWKIGVEKAGLELSFEYVKSGRVLRLGTSPYILGGFIIYAVATALYLGMLSKYPYSTVQGIVVPLALVLAFGIARLFFHETLSVTNLAGLAILVIGIFLVTRR